MEIISVFKTCSSFEEALANKGNLNMGIVEISDEDVKYCAEQFVKILMQQATRSKADTIIVNKKEYPITVRSIDIEKAREMLKLEKEKER